MHGNNENVIHLMMTPGIPARAWACFYKGLVIGEHALCLYYACIRYIL